MTKHTPDVTEALRTFSAIKSEYAYDADVLCMDSHKVRILKWIIETKLDDADKIIIKLYAELGSIRELSKMLGISRSSADKQIDRIQAVIRREYEDICRNIADNANRGVCR